SAIWRLTITGRLSLRRSAISLASPKRDGATTCTRPEDIGAGPVGFIVGSTGMARTAEGRGATLLGAGLGCWLGWADSRGMVRTLLMPPLNSSTCSWSWDRGS